jgi:hypothetical protein
MASADYVPSRNEMHVFFWVVIVETLSGREEAQQIAVQPTGSGLLNTACS